MDLIEAPEVIPEVDVVVICLLLTLFDVVPDVGVLCAEDREASKFNARAGAAMLLVEPLLRRDCDPALVVPAIPGTTEPSSNVEVVPALL